MFAPPPLKISAAARFSFLVLNFSSKNWAQKLEIPVFGDPGMIKIKSGRNLLFGEFAFFKIEAGGIEIISRVYNVIVLIIFYEANWESDHPHEGRPFEHITQQKIELREIYRIFCLQSTLFLQIARSRRIF